MPISSGFGRTLPHHDVDKISINLESKPSTSSKDRPKTAFTHSYTETTIRKKRKLICCYSV